jgi:actin-related protein
MDENKPIAIVIDNGSHKCRAGLANDDKPTIVSSVVGFKNENYKESPIEGDIFIGDEALTKKNSLILKYPIENGLNSDWDTIEKLWNYIISNQLKVNSEEHPVLFIENSINTKNNREKLTQLAFEKFKFPAICLASQAVLSLFSSGRSSGLVFDSGGGFSNVIPIYEGYSMNHVLQKSLINGNDATDYLIQLLKNNKSMPEIFNENDIVKDIKEKLCYVALDYEKEISSSNSSGSSLEKEYTLPDNRRIQIKDERFKCPELLFKPELNNLKILSKGIHEEINNTILKCDPMLQKMFYSNIIISNGNAQFLGLSKRLKNEITLLASSVSRINVINTQVNSAWSGGSILASSPTFDKMCITKADYEESGSIIVHRKCI